VTDSGGLPSQEKVLSIILEAASAVLSVPVAETDNFFDLGGDSRMAAELGDRLNEKLHGDLYVEVLLDADDMRGLAEGVRNSLAEQSGSGV
jgi:acyl carrier protein